MHIKRTRTIEMKQQQQLTSPSLNTLRISTLPIIPTSQTKKHKNKITKNAEENKKENTIEKKINFLFIIQTHF